MAVLCFVSMLCIHRSFQSNWICSSRILSLYEEWRLQMKKNFNSDLKQIYSRKFSKSSQYQESNINRPFQEITSSTTDSNLDGAVNAIEEPTTCCMSGCANCVWIQYAEELSKQYKDGGEKAKEAIMQITDPNMKAFLLTELKSLKKA